MLADVRFRLWWVLVLGVAAAVGPHPALAADTVPEPDTTTPPVSDSPAPGAPQQLELPSIGRIQARTAALLLSGQDGGELRGALTWRLVAGAAPPDAGVVQYVVEVEGTTLLADHHADVLSLGLYGYVVTPSGAIAASFAHGRTLELAPYESTLLAAGVRLTGSLTLPGGEYSLRLAVYNHQTAAFYLARTNIVVPSTTRPEPAVLPPLFTDPGGWVVGTCLPTAASPAPTSSAASLDPAAMPVLVEGEPTPFVLVGTGWPEHTRVEARLEDEQGRVFGESELTRGALLPSFSELLTMQRATLAPFDAPPGKYRLELRVLSEELTRVVATTVPVHLVEEPGSWLWASLEHLRSTPRPSRDTGEPAAPEKKIKKAAVRQLYRDALKLLSQGEPVAARRAVASLERTAFAVDAIDALELVRTQQLKVVNQLTKHELSCLWPILQLHHDLVHHYSVRSESSLTTHAWQLCLALCELACSLDDAATTRQRASAMLASSANDLLASASFTSATTLFEEALKLDPANTSALLDYALYAERSGKYLEAVPLLRRLLAEEPDAIDGRIHFAINLGRIGQRRSSIRLLRELTRPGTPDWVRILAFQELAKSLVQEDNPAAAEELLREAIELFPENQRLQIQLAYTLDRRHRPWEAAAVLEQVQPLHESQEDSPRLLYASGRSSGLLRANQKLDTFDQPKLDALRRALGAS